MREKFVSGLPDGPGTLHQPRRTIAEIAQEVRDNREKKRLKKLRFQGKRPPRDPYAVPGTPESARAAYRMIGERHPADDVPIKPAPEPVVYERFVTQLMDAVDKLPRRVSLERRIEYVLDTVDPPFTPEQWRLYRRRMFQRYGKRRSDRIAEEKAAWKAWEKQAS